MLAPVVLHNFCMVYFKTVYEQSVYNFMKCICCFEYRKIM